MGRNDVAITAVSATRSSPGGGGLLGFVKCQQSVPSMMRGVESYDNWKMRAHVGISRTSTRGSGVYSKGGAYVRRCSQRDFDRPTLPIGVRAADHPIPLLVMSLYKAVTALLRIYSVLSYSTECFCPKR